jgi:hypothetical protein
MARWLLVIALLIASRAARADEPSNTKLVLWGMAMAPPTYMVGVTLHEGSHALMAKIVGGHIEEIHLFPPGIDPKANKFRFGWVYATGLNSNTKKQLFYVAPKITDTLLLGGFAAFAFTDAWPQNKYGQLALTVFATGLWIDFAKDVILFSRKNDVAKMFNVWCMTGWKQVPGRLVYAAAIVGLGFVVWRGYDRTFFDDDPVSTPRSTASPPLVLPVLTSIF